MDNLKGALTVAEGDVAYKTDVSLAFGGSKIEKRLVLRTTLDELSVWNQKCFETDSFMELQKYCTDLISREPNKIFNSLNFSLIPEKLLITLIQNENHQMSEIQVWERVIEWGCAQNPDLPSDLESYSKNDFNRAGCRQGWRRRARSGWSRMSPPGRQ
jgi:hypothetical protein